MAIVWQKVVPRRSAEGSDHYQVRSAGRTRRLYTNGVFHSQYNPQRPVAGSVWDLLLLPAFFHEPGYIKRVLVLGVGGGAVMRQLQHFLKPGLIVGVELNPVHLSVARNFFGIDGSCFDLVEADARQWLADYNGPAFDLVIDDLFGDADGQPVRAVEADRHWCQLLQKHVTTDGSLVTNFDSPRALRASGWYRHAGLLSGWQQAFVLSTPLYENQVAVMTRQTTPVVQFRQHLRQFRELDESRSDCRLKYQLQKLTRSTLRP